MSKQKPAKAIRSVKVKGEPDRAVYYVTRPMVFHIDGNICLSPTEKASALLHCVNGRHVEDAERHVWDILNFIYDGEVPSDWQKRMSKSTATPLLLYGVE